MIENRTERVTPEQEEDVISALANFGWQLADAQEIYSESTDIKGVSVKFYDDGLIGGVMQGLTGNDGKIDVNTVKTVTNYVTLHFIRDTSMKYYQTLKEQEEIWAAAVFQEEPKKPVKRTAVCAVGFAIFLISVILALINGTQAEIWEIFVSLAFAVIMIPYTVIGWKTFKRNRLAYENMLDAGARAWDTAEQLINKQN